MEEKVVPPHQGGALTQREQCLGGLLTLQGLHGVYCDALGGWCGSEFAHRGGVLTETHSSLAFASIFRG